MELPNLFYLMSSLNPVGPEKIVLNSDEVNDQSLTANQPAEQLAQKAHCESRQLVEGQSGGTLNPIDPMAAGAREPVAIHAGSRFNCPIPGSMAVRRFIQCHRPLAVRPWRRLP
jgi:hypothetical protein